MVKSSLLTILICGLVAHVAQSFVAVVPSMRAAKVVRFADDDDDDDDFEAPSDVEEILTSISSSSRDLEASLLRLCATTSRGACATELERADIDSICRSLESEDLGKPLEGKWRLAYSSEEGLYRSSPFFWGFSQLLKDRQAPLTPRNSRNSNVDEAIYAVTDALPFYEVGNAYHTIRFGQLVSEVELKIRFFDALLPQAKSVMTTTCSAVPTPDGLSLTLEKTEVKDSTLESLPGFAFLADLAFPTQQAFSQLAESLSLAPNAANVEMLATYTSDDLRITRTEAGLCFVHVKDDPDSYY